MKRAACGKVDSSHPITMQPIAVLKKMFVFFYDIFTKQLLYLLSYTRTKPLSSSRLAGHAQEMMSRSRIIAHRPGETDT